MAQADLDAVMPIEQRSYSHPWSRGHFADSIKAGFYLPLLLEGDAPVGYLVAMPGVEEAHLLNLTVRPDRRGLGLGRLLLQTLETWAVQQRAAMLWLDVRESNASALALYQACGYEKIAVRKHYYPLSNHQREHAVVMRKLLTAIP